MFPRLHLWTVTAALLLLPYLLVPRTAVEMVDEAVVDRLSPLRSALAGTDRPAQVVVVAIDDRTLTTSERWPYRPEVVARAIETLARFQPAAIGVALPPEIRPEKTDPEGHRALASALRACGRVVLRDPSSLAESGLTTAVTWDGSLRAAAAAFGGGCWDTGISNEVRAVRFSKPSFHCKLIETSQPLTAADVIDGTLAIRSTFSQGTRVALRDGVCLDLEIPRPHRIPIVSLADLAGGKLPPDTLARRLVLLGPTSPAISRLHRVRGHGALPEILLDAVTLDDLMCGRYISNSNSSTGPLLGLLAVLAMLAGCSGPIRRARIASLLMAAVPPVASIGCYLAWGSTPELLPRTLSGLGAAAALLAARTLEDVVLSGRSLELIASLNGQVGRVAVRLIEKAVDLIERDRPGEAVEALRQAISVDPSAHQQALPHLLVCHLARQEVELIEDTFDQLETDLLSLSFAFDLGHRLADAGHLDQAKVLFGSIVSRDPGYRDAKRQLEQIGRAQASRRDVIEELVFKELKRDYQNIEPLRRGGMSVVYRAHSPQLNRSVAIKILTPHLNNDPNVVHRFFLEAETLKEFDCPNIVKVFRVEKEGQLKYYVMEHVQPSLSLRELIDRETKLPIPRATSLTQQLCTALQYVHERDVVHRDIKPHNILVGEGDLLKLIDFGIARFESISTMTSTGVVMGTPRYMSPEQIKGERVDHRTDVYAIGVVLFEMLSGITGTENPTVEKMRGGTTIHQLLLRQNLPIPLVRVILKCLEGNSSRRYDSVRELKSDLMEFDKLAPGSYEL